jgi:hypothetical protein
MMPAFRIRISSLEQRSSTRSAAALTEASEDRSSGRYSMSTVLGEMADLMSAMASWAFDWVLAARKSLLGLCFANCKIVSFPIPVLLKSVSLFLADFL